MSITPATQQIVELFQKVPVMEMSAIERAIGGRSRRSLFRDLVSLGYFSSYTHTGRYYTLVTVPEFDADGLWRYQGIGFSRDGTLTATIHRLVETSDAGRTQRELQLRLGVRTHNPLLQLVERKDLRREPFEGEYVYLAVAQAMAATQRERRRALLASGVSSVAPPALAIEVEVLHEVIHGARLAPPDAAAVALRLEARGLRVSAAEVAAVFGRHGVKKTAHSRSARSRR